MPHLDLILVLGGFEIPHSALPELPSTRKLSLQTASTSPFCSQKSPNPPQLASESPRAGKLPHLPQLSLNSLPPHFPYSLLASCRSQLGSCPLSDRPPFSLSGCFLQQALPSCVPCVFVSQAASSRPVPSCILPDYVSTVSSNAQGPWVLQGALREEACNEDGSCNPAYVSWLKIVFVWGWDGEPLPRRMFIPSNSLSPDSFTCWSVQKERAVCYGVPGHH